MFLCLLQGIPQFFDVLGELRLVIRDMPEHDVDSQVNLTSNHQAMRSVLDGLVFTQEV